MILMISGVVVWLDRSAMKLYQETIEQLRRDRLRAVILRPGESFEASIELPVGIGDNYPHLRAKTICALCARLKDLGLIVCWDCYKLHHFRTGISPEILARLETAERATAAVRSG